MHFSASCVKICLRMRPTLLDNHWHEPTKHQSKECGGYNFDSTGVRLLNKVVKVTVRVTR